LPVIIAAPHGGYLEPEDLPDLPDRHGRDNFTQEASIETAEQLHRLTGQWPHLIINHLHARKLNAARAIDEAAGDNADARLAFEDFHRFIDAAKADVTAGWGAGHYLDMHANGHDERWTEIGLGISGTLLNDDDEVILARCPLSTVANLCGPLARPLLELVRGPTSLGGMLMEAGFRAVPSPEIPRPEDGGFFYAGWNTWRHGSRTEGTIDATHVESYWRFLRQPQRSAYTEAIARAMIRFMRVHYGMELLTP
jgi:hypothetical protein